MKYFAKYLPVEGEIKDGDKYKLPASEAIHICTKSPTGLSTSLWSSTPQKVKLFLCSRDIKVGDEVLVDVLNNGVLNKYNFTGYGTDEGYITWEFRTKNQEAFFEYYPNHDKEPPPFKVIGEISPDALWVKEGDEFDEDDIKLIPFGRKIEQSENPDGTFNVTYELSGHFKIKGPCGHFH